MECRVISESLWSELLLDQFRYTDDIFCLPEYGRIWAAQERAENTCLYGCVDGVAFLYPFLKKRHPSDINSSTAYDITSSYGYGGILTNCDAPLSESIIHRVNQAIDEWCGANHIVAELVRENPWNGRRQRIRRHGATTKVRTNVYYAGPASIAEPHIAPAAMRAVRAARRSLTTRRVNDSGFSAVFYDMYVSTMTRLGAHGFYYFDDRLFRALNEKLPDHVGLHMVFLGALPIAGALCVRSDDTYVSLLVASRWEHRSLKPADLLYFSILEHAREHKLAAVSWGGGTTPSADGLFRFKRKYGNRVMDCNITTKIHNESAYALATTHWAAAYPNLAPAYGSWLLRHHQRI